MLTYPCPSLREGFLLYPAQGGVRVHKILYKTHHPPACRQARSGTSLKNGGKIKVALF